MSTEPPASVQEDGAELRLLVDALPQLAWMTDPRGRVLFYNQRWSEFTGRTLENLLQVGWPDVTHPVDFEAVSAQWMRALDTGEPVELEQRIHRYDGAWRWFLSRAVPLRDRDGAITRWVGTLTDIDAQRRVQETERRRMRQAQLVAEMGRVLVSDLPLRGTLERCTQALVDHLDAAFARVWTLDVRSQVLELEASSGLYTHLDGAHARVPVGHLKIGRIAATRHPHMTNDVLHDPMVDVVWAQSHRLVSFAGYPLLIDDRIVGVLGMFSRTEMPADTLEALRSAANTIAIGIERKRGSEALLRSEQRYELATRATTDAVWDWDLRSDELVWNDGLCDQFAFVTENVGRQPTWWLSRIHPDDREQVFTSIHEVIEGTGRDWSAEYRFQRGDGRYAQVADRAFVSRDAKQRPVRMVGAMQDITQRRRAERGLQLLARAGVRLATSADTLEACRRIAELVVPTLADWSVLDLVAGAEIERVAVAHHDRTKRAAVEAMQRHAPRATAAFGAGAVLRSSQTEWLPHVSEEDIRKAAVNAEQAQAVIDLGVSSWVRVPLVARGRVLGVLTLVREPGSAPYDAQDVRIAEELALRAALSIDTVQVLSGAQSSEQQLRSLVENLPHLAWSAQPDGYIDYFNRRWYDYTGTTLEEVQGSGWGMVHDPELFPAIKKAFDASLQLGEPFEMEFPIRAIDGSFRWFLTRVMPLRDSDGRLTRWFGTNTDIDDRRRQAAELERFAERQALVQDQLREEADRLELLNRVGKQLASELKTENIVQEVIDVATRLTGAQLGVFFYNVTDKKGDSYALWAVSGAERSHFSHMPMPRNTELFAQTFDGTSVVRLADVATDPRYGKNTPFSGLPPGGLPVRSYLAVPVSDRSGAVLGGLFFGHEQPDMFTDRAELLVVGLASQAAIAMDNARLFDEARRLIDALERSNQELDKFAYVASHDLKAPLRGISNLSQWIEDDITSIATPETLDHLRLLRGRVLRLEALINGVLHYARAGRGKPSMESVEVGPLLLDIFELLAPPPGAVLRVTTSMPTLVTDRTELQQVFMNFIGNALKYGATRPGDPGSVHVEVSAEEHPTQWIFSVADRGPGIAPEFHARIWGLFQTLQARDVVESTGIGLAVVRKVVENRGGTAWIESTPGQGATFRFSWPR